MNDKLPDRPAEEYARFKELTRKLVAVPKQEVQQAKKSGSRKAKLRRKS